MTTPDALWSLRDRGEVIWENERYGSTYIIDRAELVRMTTNGAIPVIHVGQVAAVDALTSGMSLSWLTVALTCPRPVALSRITARATGDTDVRLTAWDQTEKLSSPGMEVDTSTCSPMQAAQIIRNQLLADWRMGRAETAGERLRGRPSPRKHRGPGCNPGL